MLRSVRAPKPWFAAALAACLVPHAGRSAETLLVVPARPAIIKLAFDVAHISDTGMLSYEVLPGAAQPRLHAWNAAERAWVQTDLEAFSIGDATPSLPSHVVVIGNSQEIVSLFTSAASWADKVTPIPSLHAKDIINRLDPILEFSPEEWRWLAGRYHLQLTDDNEARRRAGRYHSEAAAAAAARKKENPLVRWYHRKMRESEGSTTIKPLIAPAPEEETGRDAAADPALDEPDTDAMQPEDASAPDASPRDSDPAQAPAAVEPEVEPAGAAPGDDPEAMTEEDMTEEKGVPAPAPRMSDIESAEPPPEATDDVPVTAPATDVDRLPADK